MEAITSKPHAPARLSQGAAEPCVGAAATAFPDATQAAMDMLGAGGNAVDAAVAAAWALAVCEPSGSGLGGQATILVYNAAGRALVIDGHSYAPEAVSKKRLSRAGQKRGYGATTIPSMPATLDFVHERYGSLSREQVMDPAIRLAHDGYAITRLQRRQLSWCRRALRKSPAAAKLFLNHGRLFKTGEIFRQPELAHTLRRIARHGSEDFYRGQIARAIASAMKENGGFISEKDLADCRLPVEREPVSVDYRGYQIVTVPPPGGGPQILLGLKIIEQLISQNADDETWYEAHAQTTHAIFNERDLFPLHPRDGTASSCDWFVGEQHARQIAERINRNAWPQADGTDLEEPGDTTHLCVADDRGNVVSLTQSIQSLFGAKVASRRLGFLYNNYLSTCPRRKHPYRLAGNCMPRSNAAPTLVLEKGRCRPILTLGAAGSRRITSAILQVITNVIDRGMSLEQAVACPRIHGLKSGKVYLERPAATESLVNKLNKNFRAIKIKGPRSYAMAAVQAIEFRKDGAIIGAADPRRDGAATGI